VPSATTQSNNKIKRLKIYQVKPCQRNVYTCSITSDIVAQNKKPEESQKCTVISGTMAVMVIHPINQLIAFGIRTKKKKLSTCQGV
jgi:hypothetical protein